MQPCESAARIAEILLVLPGNRLSVTQAIELAVDLVSTQVRDIVPHHIVREILEQL